MAAQRLKIGLVLDDTLDSPDGVQQYVLTLGAWLSGQGHTVHYLVGQTSRTDVAQVHSLARNWRVQFNGNRLSIPLPASRQGLRALLRTEQFDVLHIQTPYSPFLSGRLIRLAPAQTAVVGTFHILPYNGTVVLANRLLALLNHNTARRFDAMIANSAPAKAFALSAYGFTSVIIPNPFPAQAFNVPAPASTTPAIVFLGRLVERKGALQLLQALAYMQAHALLIKPLQVIIGGKGPMLDKLKKFTADNHLDMVTFAGFVAEADKPAFLAQADIAVFPSISGESFGISLLEAMAAAHGVVIGGDNPGYRSVIAPLSEELLINPNDTAQFAQLLADWLADKDKRTAAAAQQKKYVQQFDIDRVGQEIVKVYSEALRSRENVQ